MIAVMTHLVAELLDLGLAERLALHELGDPAINLVVGRHDVSERDALRRLGAMS